MPDSPEFVLLAPIATEKCGKPIVYSRPTGIGPMTSADPDEWKRYASRDDALRSPAMCHPLAVFDVVTVEEASDAAIR